MNPAARAAFGLTLADFSNALAASLIRSFGRCVKNRVPSSVAVKIGGAAPLRCSVEILQLAGGENGLIVAEVEADSDVAPAAPRVCRKKQAVAATPKPKKRRAPSVKAAPAKPASPPALSTDEARAFQAVGRKIRRLCEKKRIASAECAAAAAAPARPQPPLPDIEAAQTLRAALAVFDLVLLLGEGLQVVRVEGRPRLSWSKADLMGRPVSDLVPAADQAQVRRMLGRLKRGAWTARDSLHVFDAQGNPTLCRAVLGRHDQGAAAFFFGVVSLELPERLKKRTPDARDRAVPSLAA
jgi:hypothetical protein